MTDRTAVAGTGQLARLALRRDRVMLPLWVVGVSLLTLSTVTSYRSLYPTVASRLAYAHAVEASGGLIALTGAPFDLSSIGGLTAWRTVGFDSLMIAILSVLLVTRHTRAEEESSRLELLGGAVVGRFAALTAAVQVALLADLLIAVLCALTLIGYGEAPAGSLAYGLACALSGVVFIGIAAVTAQLTESSRTANGMACSLAALAYLLRAIGDATSAHWVSWLSPIGWSEQVRPFAGERWWLLPVGFAVAAALLVVAARLVTVRDFGAGVLAGRGGPAGAARWLNSTTALAWRLQRSALLTWAIGFALVGAVLGGLAGNVTSFADNPQARALLRSIGSSHDLVDSYFATIFTVAGLTAAGYAVQAVLRLPAEESRGLAEPLLAAPVGRIRWAGGHLAIGLLGSSLLMALFGLGAGLVRGVQVHDLAGQSARLVGAAVVQSAAVWVLGALVVVLFGWVPGWTPAAWGAVVLALALSLLGPLLHLPHWALQVSPFSHLPHLPGGHVSALPLAALLAVTLVLVAAGLAGLTRRDLR